MKSIFAVLVLGVLVIGCGSNTTPREEAQKFAMNRLEVAMRIPPTTEAGLRQRIWHYISVGQLAKAPARGVFVGVDEQTLQFYRDLVNTFATEDTRRLYSKYLERATTLTFNENEETFYTFYHALNQLGLDCPYPDPDCSAETFRENGEHTARLMITEPGGLLDQLRADPKSAEAPYLIHRLIMRWELWNDLPFKENERIRVATTFSRFVG